MSSLFRDPSNRSAQQKLWELGKKDWGAIFDAIVLIPEIREFYDLPVSRRFYILVIAYFNVVFKKLNLEIENPLLKDELDDLLQIETYPVCPEKNLAKIKLYSKKDILEICERAHTSMLSKISKEKLDIAQEFQNHGYSLESFLMPIKKIFEQESKKVNPLYSTRWEEIKNQINNEDEENVFFDFSSELKFVIYNNASSICPFYQYNLLQNRVDKTVKMLKNEQKKYQTKVNNFIAFMRKANFSRMDVLEYLELSEKYIKNPRTADLLTLGYRFQIFGPAMFAGTINIVKENQYIAEPFSAGVNPSTPKNILAIFVESINWLLLSTKPDNFVQSIMLWLIEHLFIPTPAQLMRNFYNCYGFFGLYFMEIEHTGSEYSIRSGEKKELVSLMDSKNLYIDHILASHPKFQQGEVAFIPVLDGFLFTSNTFEFLFLQTHINAVFQTRNGFLLEPLDLFLKKHIRADSKERKLLDDFLHDQTTFFQAEPQSLEWETTFRKMYSKASTLRWDLFTNYLEKNWIKKIVCSPGYNHPLEYQVRRDFDDIFGHDSQTNSTVEYIGQSLPFLSAATSKISSLTPNFKYSKFREAVEIAWYFGNVRFLYDLSRRIKKNKKNKYFALLYDFFQESLPIFATKIPYKPREIDVLGFDFDVSKIQREKKRKTSREEQQIRTKLICGYLDKINEECEDWKKSQQSTE